MADIPGVILKLNDVEIAVDAPVTEALFDKIGANINALIDEEADLEARVVALEGQGPNIIVGSTGSSTSISVTITPSDGSNHIRITTQPSTTGLIIINNITTWRLTRGGTPRATWDGTLSSTSGSLGDISVVDVPGSTAAHTYTFSRIAGTGIMAGGYRLVAEEIKL